MIQYSPSYADGAAFEISTKLIEELKTNGLDKPWIANVVKATVKAEVYKVMESIQSRLYQHALSELLAIAHDLRPETARKDK